MDIRAKIIRNKKNNQLMIALSRKKLQLIQSKSPKFINLKIKKLEYG